MRQNETITIYQHTVKDLNGKQIGHVYTNTQEEFDEFNKGLESLVLVVMIKYLAIGMLIGVLIGFFSAAQANDLVRSEIVKSIKHKENIKTLIAIAAVESSFNPKAIGKAKEVGLFQFHPRFFKGVDIKSSIERQVQIAESHLTWLKEHCKTHISLCWNLGVKGAMDVQNPKEFIYYKKFKRALLNEQNKTETTKNTRAVASYKYKVLHNKNNDSQIRKRQVESITWTLGRREQYFVFSK